MSFPLRSILLSVVFLFAATAPAAAAAGFTLEQAIEQALARNESPAQAGYRIERAEAFVREAWGTLLPSLTVTGIYTRRAREVVRQVGGEDVIIQSRDGLAGSAVAELDLVNLPAIPQIRSSRRLEDAARADAVEVRRDLAFLVSETYLAVLAAQELVRVAEQRVEQSTRVVTDATARAGAGLASRTDVTRAQVERAGAELARTQARNTLARAVFALEYLIASPLPGELTAPELPAPIEAAPADLIPQAIGQREDLKSLNLRAEAASLRARAAWYRYLPSLGAQGTYRLTNETGLSGYADDWNLALTATWRLFDGGIAAAQAGQFRAEARIANLEFKANERAVGYEIRTAQQDLETARSAIREAEAAVEAADTYLRDISQRYAAGLASGLEQADASLSAYQARAALVQRRLDYWRAGLALRNALGLYPIESVTEEPS